MEAYGRNGFGVELIACNKTVLKVDNLDAIWKEARSDARLDALPSLIIVHHFEWDVGLINLGDQTVDLTTTATSFIYGPLIPNIQKCTQNSQLVYLALVRSIPSKMQLKQLYLRLVCLLNKSLRSFDLMCSVPA